MAKILIVDDDDKIVRMLTLRLCRQGYEVDSVSNGQECIDRLDTGSYDLVLLDMHMPIMDGHQAVQILRERGYAGIILAVTASAMSIDSKKAMDAGCDDYIAKPIGTDFEDKIAHYLIDAGCRELAMLSEDDSLSSKDYLLDIEAQLADLRRRFIDELMGRQEKIESTYQAFLLAPDSGQALDAFYKSLHNLSGSAATFGLEEVSQCTHEIEALIRPLQKNPMFGLNWVEISTKMASLKALSMTSR